MMDNYKNVEGEDNSEGREREIDFPEVMI